MNKISKAAVLLGSIGGKAGTGKCKSRRSDMARAAAIARWGTAEERFWKKVRKGKPGECWAWIGDNCTNNGYGRVWPHGSRPILAHRFSWTLKNGPIPPGMKVLHKCDNPPCCNPDHLFLGTQSDNTNDCISKGRFVVMSGEKNGHSLLTEKDVLEIRRRHAAGSFQRQLARDFKTDRRNIKWIVTRHTWKHI